ETLGLPHLDLAADVGAHHRLGRLVVSVVPAIAGANGCCCPDLGVIALTGPDLRTWRHELGHLLDPALEDRSTVQGEAFADLMATLLADTSPATATEAAA